MTESPYRDSSVMVGNNPPVLPARIYGKLLSCAFAEQQHSGIRCCGVGAAHALSAGGHTAAAKTTRTSTTRTDVFCSVNTPRQQATVKRGEIALRLATLGRATDLEVLHPLPRQEPSGYHVVE